MSPQPMGPTTVADAASLAATVSSLVITGALATASVVMLTRWWLPPWRAWWRASRGLSLKQRWQVGTAVQLCRRAKDPALLPAMSANIAFRRQLLAVTDKRTFRALRTLFGLLLLLAALAFLLGSPRVSPHGPVMPLPTRAFVSGGAFTGAAFLIAGYPWLTGWVRRRLDRCEALNHDEGRGGP